MDRKWRWASLGNYGRLGKTDDGNSRQRGSEFLRRMMARLCVTAKRGREGGVRQNARLCRE